MGRARCRRSTTFAVRIVVDLQSKGRRNMLERRLTSPFVFAVVIAHEPAVRTLSRFNAGIVRSGPCAIALFKLLWLLWLCGGSAERFAQLRSRLKLLYWASLSHNRVSRVETSNSTDLLRLWKNGMLVGSIQNRW